MRLQSQTAVLSGGEKYSVDQFALTDIRSVLKDQQEGIQVLIKIMYWVLSAIVRWQKLEWCTYENLIQALVACVREDLADLATMAEGLQEGSTKGEGAWLWKTRKYWNILKYNMF